MPRVGFGSGLVAICHTRALMWKLYILQCLPAPSQHVIDGLFLCGGMEIHRCGALSHGDARDSIAFHLTGLRRVARPSA
jgi:hypothetical protein